MQNIELPARGSDDYLIPPLLCLKRKVDRVFGSQPIVTLSQERFGVDVHTCGDELGKQQMKSFLHQALHHDELIKKMSGETEGEGEGEGDEQVIASSTSAGLQSTGLSQVPLQYSTPDQPSNLALSSSETPPSSHLPTSSLSSILPSVQPFQAQAQAQVQARPSNINSLPSCLPPPSTHSVSNLPLKQSSLSSSSSSSSQPPSTLPSMLEDQLLQDRIFPSVNEKNEGNTSSPYLASSNTPHYTLPNPPLRPIPSISPYTQIPLPQSSSSSSSTTTTTLSSSSSSFPTHHRYHYSSQPPPRTRSSIDAILTEYGQPPAFYDSTTLGKEFNTVELLCKYGLAPPSQGGNTVNRLGFWRDLLSQQETRQLEVVYRRYRYASPPPRVSSSSSSSSSSVTAFAQFQLSSPEVCNEGY